MANELYDKGRNSFLKGEIAWLTDTIKATLIDTADYTVNLSTHQYMNLDTVAAAAKVSTATLGTKTAVDGMAGAATTTFTSVSGDESEAIIIWKDGGGGGTTQSGTTDLLIAYIDTATGLPVTPNGNDIDVDWDDVEEIFTL